ncbi:MAG: hypothetical protein ACPK7O_01120 [Methanobacterium sp.]
MNKFNRYLIIILFLISLFSILIMLLNNIKIINDIALTLLLFSIVTIILKIHVILEWINEKRIIQRIKLSNNTNKSNVGKELNDLTRIIFFWIPVFIIINFIAFIILNNDIKIQESLLISLAITSGYIALSALSFTYANTLKDNKSINISDKIRRGGEAFFMATIMSLLGFFTLIGVLILSKTTFRNLTFILQGFSEFKLASLIFIIIISTLITLSIIYFARGTIIVLKVLYERFEKKLY